MCFESVYSYKERMERMEGNSMKGEKMEGMAGTGENKDLSKVKDQIPYI